MGKIRLNKKVVLSTVGIVLLIAAAGSAGILLRKTQDAKNDDKTSSQDGRLPENVSEIQDLQSAGNQEAADAKIDEILKDGSASDTDKHNAYIQRGNGLTAQEDYAGAVEAYKNAVAAKKTYEAVFILAEAYEKAGNIPEAIKNFQEAHDIMPDGPVSGAEKRALKTRIQALSEGQR